MMKKILLAMFLPLAGLSVSAETVGPLLKDWVRHQSAPFNNYCPYYTENGVASKERCLVGCVATALEMVISYHQREIVLQEPLEGWSTPNYTLKDIPKGTRVNTSLILPDYGDGTAASVGMNEEDYAAAADQVALLSLMCGMASHMNYNVSASGADAHNLIEPMKTAFGWKTAEFVDSYNYTPEQWKELIKNEIRNGRPVLYTGYTMNIGGHAFVIDGFNDEDMFHLNWGYGGEYYDHYYDITELDAFEDPMDRTPLGVMQGFFCNQQAVLLSPDACDMSLAEDSLQRTGEEIEILDIAMANPIYTNKYTPVSITLRNNADIPLCSPFEIFTNVLNEKKPFEKGDYGALFGVNLQPGETRTLTVHCKFSEAGTRVLNISPDDKLIFGKKKITLTKGSSDDLSFGTPTLDMIDETTAKFSFDVMNNKTETSGTMATYCIFPGEDLNQSNFRHFEYLYIPGGEQQVADVTFKNLEPSSTYTFVLRWPWTIRQKVTFSTELRPDGLATTPLIVEDDHYYDLSGRRTNARHGLLIHHGKKVLK